MFTYAELAEAHDLMNRTSDALDACNWEMSGLTADVSNGGADLEAARAYALSVAEHATALAAECARLLNPNAGI